MGIAGTRAQPLQAIFRDGLGTRHLRESPGGLLEVLTLHQHLTVVSTFEFLLRERVTRLAHFHQPCYAHVRGVERGGDGGAKLAVVFDHAPGVRLSHMLAMAEQNLLPLDVDSALCLIRKLLTAVALLHESAPDVCHGALAPERVVISPDTHLVIVEHVLGAALEQLQLSPEQYWDSLRIALPPADGSVSTGAPGRAPHFTRRTDVVQVGTIALALLLGRPIADDEYPEGIGDLANGTFGLGGNFDALPPWLRTWLSRALWLDHADGFASAADARHAFDAGLSGSSYTASQTRLESFLAQYRASVEERPAEAPSPAAEAPPPAAEPRPAPPPPAPASIIVATASQPSHEEVDVPQTHTAKIADDSAGDSQRTRLIAAALIIIALTSGGVMATRRYLTTVPPPAQATGTLAVQTSPAGASVVIDGRQRGVSPLVVTVNAGPHTLELSADGVHRTIPLTVTANAALSQFIEMPKAAPAVGQLEVRTDPSGAKVTVDGEFRGVSPIVVSGLSPGSHKVALENDQGAVTEDVTVAAGTTAALVVPLRSTQGAPASGWMSITAPAEVQVFENQRLLGSSRTDRIMVTAGRHDLEIVNEALGYRSSLTVQVAPGQVAKVKPDWPQGTIAINAAPWANVWLDGQELGETPVGNTQVPIGTHDVIFRHPQLGEQRFTATVTATAPARLSVDMRKK